MRIKEPLVTILIPCYNAMPYLTEAIDSALGQTYTRLEILCLNDGSTDQTGTILEQYRLKDSRIKVLHNEDNIKLIKTLNKGISHASGDYVARLDADDVVDSKWIDKCLEILLKPNPPDLVSCYVYHIDCNGKKLKAEVIRQTRETPCLFASFFYVPVHHGSMVCKTEVLKNFMFLEEDHAVHTEDYELFSRMLRNGIKMRNYPERLYCVRMNPNSVSQLYTHVQDENFVQCVHHHVSKFFQISTTHEVIRVFANRMTADTSLFDLKNGIMQISAVRNLFVNSRAKDIDSMTKREINVVFHTHLLNVCLQAIKKTGWKQKLYASMVLILRSYMLFNKTVFRYGMNKFKN
jgi:glycosyltransferase involved in cell wall biosynthesis